jgi:hypothetical protein
MNLSVIHYIYNNRGDFLQNTVFIILVVNKRTLQEFIIFYIFETILTMST